MLWLAVKRRGRAELGAGNCGWGPQSLVLTRWAGIPTLFTRRLAFRIAPWPGLSEAETFPDIRQEVVDDAAVILWHKASLDWGGGRRLE